MMSGWEDNLWAEVKYFVFLLKERKMEKGDCTKNREISVYISSPNGKHKILVTSRRLSWDGIAYLYF